MTEVLPFPGSDWNAPETDVDNPETGEEINPANLAEAVRRFKIRVWGTDFKQPPLPEGIRSTVDLKTGRIEFILEDSSEVID